MNQVSMIGRLTKDPDVKYAAGSQTAIARFTVAINRGKDKDGNDRGADFPSVICFGKTAELVERYLGKGRLVGITGRIQTGKYEKEERTVYTTDVVADRVEFLDWPDDGKDEAPARQTEMKPTTTTSAPVEGFGALTDDDIPF
jgi:single-strand DNA-binding protein